MDSVFLTRNQGNNLFCWNIQNPGGKGLCPPFRRPYLKVYDLVSSKCLSGFCGALFQKVRRYEYWKPGSQATSSNCNGFCHVTRMSEEMISRRVRSVTLKKASQRSAKDDFAWLLFQPVLVKSWSSQVEDSKPIIGCWKPFFSWSPEAVAQWLSRESNLMKLVSNMSGWLITILQL